MIFLLLIQQKAFQSITGTTMSNHDNDLTFSSDDDNNNVHAGLEEQEQVISEAESFYVAKENNKRALVAMSIGLDNVEIDTKQPPWTHLPCPDINPKKNDLQS